MKAAKTNLVKEPIFFSFWGRNGWRNAADMEEGKLGYSFGPSKFAHHVWISSFLAVQVPETSKDYSYWI